MHAGMSFREDFSVDGNRALAEHSKDFSQIDVRWRWRFGSDISMFADASVEKFSLIVITR
jgi:hypothetical protein